MSFPIGLSLNSLCRLGGASWPCHHHVCRGGGGKANFHHHTDESPKLRWCSLPPRRHVMHVLRLRICCDAGVALTFRLTAMPAMHMAEGFSVKRKQIFNPFKLLHTIVILCYVCAKDRNFFSANAGTYRAQFLPPVPSIFVFFVFWVHSHTFNLRKLPYRTAGGSSSGGAYVRR